MKRNEDMVLVKPLVLTRLQERVQSLLGWRVSALTGRRVAGLFSWAGAMRTLSSSNSLYHCLVDNTVMFRGQFSL